MRSVCVCDHVHVLCLQELRTGVALQQLQSDVNSVLSAGRSLIHSSPVGIDTSDIESTVNSVGRLLTDINQQVIHAEASLSSSSHPSGCWSTASRAVVLTLMREHYCCVYLYMQCRLMYCRMLLIYTKQLPISGL